MKPQTKKRKKPGPKKGAQNAGRPKKPIDLISVRKLAEMQCTDTEIAAFLDIPQSTFSIRKKTDDKLSDIIKRARDIGKSSLRRAQFKKALGGHATMLIWLGKQYLDQSDKSEHTVRDISAEELRKLTKEQLDELERTGNVISIIK